MTMVTIQAPGEGEIQGVDETQLDAYADWTVIAEGAPFDEAVIDEGTWIVPLEVLKLRKREAVMLRLQEAFFAGFTIPTGPIAGRVLQVRDDTDRTNWLTSKDSYRDGIEAGYGDVAGQAVFRTLDNEVVSCTFNEGFAVLQAMAVWGRDLMINSWTLKDAITAAADVEALDAIDIEVGWL